jgi:hypothetical protein
MVDLTVKFEPPPISVGTSPEVLIGAGVILVVLGIIAAVKNQQMEIVL